MQEMPVLTAEALQEVDSLNVDAHVVAEPTSWAGDYVTGTALKQGREVDAAVVVQQQPPMVETVPKA